MSKIIAKNTQKEPVPPIKFRLWQYLSDRGITKKECSDATGISYGNIRASKSEFGGDHIAKILAEYKDLSPDWLINGTGSPSREIIEYNNNSNNTTKTNESNTTYNVGGSFVLTSDSNKSQIESQDNQISFYIRQIESLQAIILQQQEHIGRLLSILEIETSPATKQFEVKRIIDGRAYKKINTSTQEQQAPKKQKLTE